MSDLTNLRDHARHMAVAEHLPTCRGTSVRFWGELTSRPHPDCFGCVSEAHRHLWARIAEEIDTYLAAPADSVDLFGEVTSEPAHAGDYVDPTTGGAA